MGQHSGETYRNGRAARNDGAAATAAKVASGNKYREDNEKPQFGAGSKNVSHVPCKFFRQGACQAGDSCPFSHAIDKSGEASVCRYFQNGNCKFGNKCALAHITPDGKRINKPHSRSKQGQQSRGPGGASTGGGASHPAADPAARKLKAQVSPPRSFLPHTGPAVPGAVSAPPTSRSSPFLPSVAPIQIAQTPSRACSLGVARPTAGSAGSIQSTLHAYYGENQFFNPRHGSYTCTSSASLWMDRPKNPLAYEGSAIIDDEDEDEEEGYEEDLVPSALSDLLTPQERERRNSRHSSSTRPRPDVSMSPASDFWQRTKYPSISYQSLAPRALDPIGTPERSRLNSQNSSDGVDIGLATLLQSSKMSFEIQQSPNLVKKLKAQQHQLAAT